MTPPGPLGSRPSCASPGATAGAGPRRSGATARGERALLLDSGVWLAARDVDDPFHEPARMLIARAGTDRAAALDLTLYEVSNVATVRWRAPDEAELLAELVLRAADERLVRVDADLLADAIQLAAAGELTLYDAAYVACARSRGWTLVSTDLRDLVRPGLATSPTGALG